MADALILTKRDDGVAIVSTNDDPLNRMTLESVSYTHLTLPTICSV